MNSDNPYSSPVSPAAAEDRPAAERESLGTIARRTFLAWEKLRLVYIAVLAVFALLFGLLDPSNMLASMRFWMFVLEGAIIANICYFAGPVIETYVFWLGFRGNWLRIVMFVVGTLFSCVLFVGAMVGQSLSTID